ncbi:NMCC_0638 family (lipo)protein [Neisseria yangbaofengii]|uniref:NMCC_0638 family (lipo)protein n=1 Tax=Neisseria yangbaofengii TaxID=2709396 RepID=UPI003FCE9078
MPFGMMELEKNQAAHYFSLAPESYSSKTEKVGENMVRQQFMQLAGQAPQGLSHELRSGKSTQSPFPFRQFSYAWRESGSPGTGVEGRYFVIRSNCPRKLRYIVDSL